MKIEARNLAQESWDATQTIGLLYADIALSSDFRHTLDTAAHEALTTGTRSGVAGLEAFDDEVQRRIQTAKTEAPPDVPVDEEAAPKKKAAKKSDK